MMMKIKNTAITIVLLTFCVVLCSSVKNNVNTSAAETQADATQTPWQFNTPFPFDQPSGAALRAMNKKVFAHYFTQFPISIDNDLPASDYYQDGYLNPYGENGKHIAYGGFLRNRPLPRPVRPEANWMELDMDEEVRLAAALGIDGFACDLLSYQGYHLYRTKMLLESANRIGGGFKIMLMPDIEVFKTIPDSLTRLIKTLAAYPAAYRLNDGRLVVAPYNAQGLSVAWWTNWLNNMKNQGIDIAFLPVFQDWSSYAPTYSPISYGMSDWGWRSTKIQSSWKDVPAKAKAFGPLWMMPVAPQDMRPYSYTYSEAANSAEYRVMWENAIQGGADWVQLITWNDYSEHTCIRPSTKTQYAYYDLTAYYTTWFKTGTQPEIKRDVLYYFYRVHSTTAPTIQSRSFTTAFGTDAPSNQIELLAFLVSPGTLEIEIDGKVTRQDVPAGMSSLLVPLSEGKPIFRLLRQNNSVIVLPGAFEINNAITFQDLLYYGGSNTRLPVSAETLPSQPYKGTPTQIPGKLEVENYDLGAANTICLDSDGGNNGGKYRSDNVDIGLCTDTGAGYNIGWTNAGEWTIYSVDVNDTIVDIDFRVAAISGAKVKLELDDRFVGEISFTPTGGWLNWKTFSLKNVKLAGGKNKKLKLTILQAGFDINWISFSKSVTVGIKTIESPELKIYSSPAKNELYIESSEFKYDKIEISDISGRLIQSLQVTFEPKKHLALSLPDGIYCLKISNKSQLITRMFVIK